MERNDLQPLSKTFRPSIKEKCGLFGIFNGEEASEQTRIGLFELQHRGQKGTGIASANGSQIVIKKGDGLVSQFYSEKDIKELIGHISIGHNRYPTSGGLSEVHNQPVFNPDGVIALAHNGNLPTTKKLEDFLESKGINTSGRNDSELMHDAISYYLLKGASLEDSVIECYPLFTGVFSLLLMTKDSLAALRDQCGIKPLVMSKRKGGVVIASEPCALPCTFDEDSVFSESVTPGQMVVIDKKGLRRHQLASSDPHLDVFEYIYFARPDSELEGVSVYLARENAGRMLAEEDNLYADLVVDVPRSGTPAAMGYSQQSGIPHRMGLLHNPYIHRTFITPGQSSRQREAEKKYKALSAVVAGKSVVTIDDSLVRSTTQRVINEMLWRAGAREVHNRLASPPVKYPCFYGTDLPMQEELIASKMTSYEIGREVGATSLKYLSLEGLIKAIGKRKDELSLASLTGEYPIPIGERVREFTLAI